MGESVLEKQNYYYGQGKVWLSKRHPVTGKPLGWRWIGDVSALSLSLSVESISHTESYTGQRLTALKIAGKKEGSLSSTWHNHSPENLATLFYGENVITAAGSVSGELLPEKIEAGMMLALAHPQVSNLILSPATGTGTALKEGEDYFVREAFGEIEFLKAVTTQYKAAYSHSRNINVPMFNRLDENYALRYSGINLADNGAAVIVELYKIAVDPAQAKNLINTDTSVEGMEMTAGILMDDMRAVDDELGMFGRIQMVKEES